MFVDQVLTYYVVGTLLSVGLPNEPHPIARGLVYAPTNVYSAQGFFCLIKAL